MRICKNCNYGKVKSEKRVSKCLYCRGKGIRTSNYGVDEIKIIEFERRDRIMKIRDD